MERLSGASNWRLKIKVNQESVSILCAVSCDEKAMLPDEIYGMPVTELGRRALGSDIRETQGEEVVLACGPLPEKSEWDNGKLLDLTLPAGLKRIGDFAFSNCRRLQTLRLWDDIDSWGGNVLTTCRSLSKIILSRTSDGQGIALSRIVDELSQELDVTIKEGEQKTRLIFPDYEESYEEIYPARGVHFAYHISGAGYLHHHCFYQRKLALRDYDDLWEKYMGLGYDKNCAVRLAWWRLRYPAELAEKAGERYMAYLSGHISETVEWLLSERDTQGLAFLLERVKPDREMLAAAAAAARESGCPEALALLLEEQHKLTPAALDKNFDL